MPKTFRLHLETSRDREPLFQLTAERWKTAAKRNRTLARLLDVSIGWDGDILEHALHDADILIMGASVSRTDLRTRAPRLRWIQTTGAGVDGLMPLDWLPEGVALTNNSGAHGPKAEDSCAMAMLMLNARIPQVMASQRAARWEPPFTTPIAGKTVLVIGFGDLGQAAGRAARKLGVKVIAVTRSGRASRLAHVVEPVSRLDRVLPKADFVIVAAPLTAQTQGLLSRDRLNLLKPGAGLVNIGRAPIVDTDAVREKLADGSLSGAILDVFTPEPLPAESPLWNTPNLVVLPHITCDDPRYIDMLFDFWFENFARFSAGKPLRNRVDPKLGY